MTQSFDNVILSQEAGSQHFPRASSATVEMYPYRLAALYDE